MYKGSDSKCVVDNLEPGAEYRARVCPIRLTESHAELAGAFSNPTTFTIPESSASGGAATKQASHTNISGASPGATPNHAGHSKSRKGSSMTLVGGWLQRSKMPEWTQGFLYGLGLLAVSLLAAFFLWFFNYK